MAGYLAKVRGGAYEITDADVERLKSAGCSEDEIFELTVAVAIREGLRRLGRSSTARTSSGVRSRRHSTSRCAARWSGARANASCSRASRRC
jgi:hypothetical protein